jgi:hypothetical protein
MSASMINVELGRDSTAPFDINGTPERTLAGKPSGTIKLSDFYGKSADPYYANTKLILHNDVLISGTNVQDFSPSAQNGLLGSPAALSTSTFKFGPGSVAFPSGAANIQFTASPANRFDLNFTNWTWELWYYETSGSLGSLISQRSGTNGWSLTTTGLRAMINGVYSDTQMTMAAPSQNAWHHFAWVKSADVLAIYVDGTLTSFKSGVSTIAFNSGVACVMGIAAQGGENPFRGFMDDTRYTRDVARYTANFTPPTQPFPNS